jgi:hypothetical protein
MAASRLDSSQGILQALASLPVPALAQALASPCVDGIWRNPIERVPGGYAMHLRLPAPADACLLGGQEAALATGLHRPTGAVTVEPLPHLSRRDLVLWIHDQPTPPAQQAEPAQGEDGAGEVLGVDTKGSPECADLQDLSARYAALPPESSAEILATLQAPAAELHRRAARLRDHQHDQADPSEDARQDARPGGELRPRVVVVDETHRLFDADADLAGPAAELLAALARRGPVTGVIVVHPTSRPDTTDATADGTGAGGTA